MSDSAPKQIPPYGLRMPPDLKERVQVAAVANNRSMNAEIIARLEASFESPQGAVSVNAGGTHYEFRSYEEFTAVVMDAVSKANKNLVEKGIRPAPSDDD